MVALVVDSKIRNQGIGKMLVNEAEKWAKEQGAISIGLNSGNRKERQNAHRFYVSVKSYPPSTSQKPVRS
ncbi:GNAT family N-acetyltransferase [Brevibacillus sp. WF146]|uniref:GNAT family N-acetyltransferase n=1 Tax=Brevibacillus sp. WF146 TaxID=319501 RepID=UPI0021000932|nr:GNAT family N-acetyltransferase [Brevibacillus sp. WF146]UYZ15549.1 GNAT family N-acetyltransferase [Brevibacillus sp. WF146]